jgi:glycosyltransferase involved in cell wall biosynthesis
MVIANLSNLCWVTDQQRRNQAIFSHLLLDTDGFEEGFFLQPPVVKTARAFQFSRPPEIEVVLKPGKLGRPVTVLQPVLTLPSGYPAPAARRAITELGQMLVKDYFQNRPYLLWINSITHFQAQLAEQMMPGAGFRVFDSSDLMMMYQRNGGEQIKRAGAILKNSDVALCSNERALKHLPHPTKCVLSHCTEYTVFQQAGAVQPEMPPLFPKTPGAVYIGFTGMITVERIDFDLLHAIFIRFPNYHFIFVGTTNRPSMLARLKSYPNFHYIPEVREEVLGAIIHQFDVAIVPELDNDYTRGSDGTKILDYLACGVPVLSTTSPNGEKFGESVHVAGSVWEFSYLLERLVTKSRPNEPQFGKTVAQRHSWRQEVPRFLDWMFERRREQERSAQTIGGRLVSTAKAYL